MQLSYRGVTYEPTTLPISMVEGEVGGKYRNAIWRFRSPQSRPEPRFGAELKYRGMTYWTGSLAVRHQNSQPASAAQSLKTLASVMTPMPQDVAKAHLKNIYTNIERRLQAAKAQGNYHLVSLLESELHQVGSN